jgi:hypothetical protein
VLQTNVILNVLVVKKNGGDIGGGEVDCTVDRYLLVMANSITHDVSKDVCISYNLSLNVQSEDPLISRQTLVFVECIAEC